MVRPQSTLSDVMAGSFPLILRKVSSSRSGYFMLDFCYSDANARLWPRRALHAAPSLLQRLHCTVALMQLQPINSTSVCRRGERESSHRESSPPNFLAGKLWAKRSKNRPRPNLRTRWKHNLT